MPCDSKMKSGGKGKSKKGGGVKRGSSRRGYGKGKSK